MKDSLDSPVISRGNEADVYANRRLIRPTLRRAESPRPENGDRRERADRPERPANGGKKLAPPEQTHAENFYYQKQMQSKTPMVLVLQDDEEVHGVIEWYDKYCLKVTREGEPNLLIYKPSIKYMYKENEEGDGK
jgi:sRNA-binding regulator protein Hfq